MCVKHKLVLSANIIGSNVLKAFFKSFTYKRNKSSPKIEPFGTPKLLVSELVLSFSLIWMNCLLSELIHPWILSLIPYSSNFWEEWSGMQCQKVVYSAIGQLIHQAYIFYFQKIQLFAQLIVLQHGQLNERFRNQIV